VNKLSISAITYDLTSPLEFEILPESVLQEISRRMTRTQTLDLGVSIVDNGFSHGDRTMMIQAKVSEAIADALVSLVQTYSLLNFSLPEGVFSGAISNFMNDSGDISFSILINEKLSED